MTLSLGSWIVCAHCLTERNIWVKFNENHPKGSGDMERTQNSRVNPLTLSLGSWVMCSAHCLTEKNICVKINENCTKDSEDMEWTQIEGYITLP